MVVKSFRIDKRLHTRLEQYKHVLLETLTLLETNLEHKPDVIRVVFGAFVDVLAIASHDNNLDGFVFVLCTSSSQLVQCLNLICNLNASVPVRPWLHSISDKLAVIGATGDTNNEMNMFTKLTNILRMYVTIEYVHFSTPTGRMSESIYFLEKCIRMKCFAGLNYTLYREFFRIIKGFLPAVESVEKFNGFCERMKTELRYDCVVE